MSSCIWDQLRHSYSRVIDKSLKEVREKGLLREASPDILEEIGRRWRADLESEVSKREGPRPARDSQAALCAGGTANVPSASALGPLRRVVPTLKQAPVAAFSFMNGVTFAEGPPMLPAPVPHDQVPCVLQGISLETSNVELPPVAPKANSMVSAPPKRQGKAKAKDARPKPAHNIVPASRQLPPAKRMRRISSPAASEFADGASQPPLSVPTAPALPFSPDSDADGGEEWSRPKAGPSDADIVRADADFAIVPLDDDEHTPAPLDLFGDPVSAAEDGTIAEAAEAIIHTPSPGSELGSDLDGSEASEPEGDNLLVAENIQVTKRKNSWVVHIQQGVIRIGDMECLLCTAHGKFEIKEGDEPRNEADDGSCAIGI